jgi:L-malate glycosyltransferase
MKILELTNYSAGSCGVFMRAIQEASMLSERGHNVRMFSSNLTKGSEKIAKSSEFINGVEITRFPSTKLGGESFISWNFEKQALDFRPEIIIAHSYRHLHSTKALKIAKKIGARVFLITHAPFGRVDRGFFSKIMVYLYDHIIGKYCINKFDKVIRITNWELPYLRDLGLNDKKIEYVPNGIPELFFTQKKIIEQEKILFLGRISPIKDLETLIRAISLLKNKKVKLEIVGPAEEDYLKRLKDLINELNLGDRIYFSPAIYDISEKIKKIDSCKIFVLPSKSEGMPQSLIEAMAREKVVIASNNQGAMDLINDKVNGYLFNIGDWRELADKIDRALVEKNNLPLKAKKSVEKFNWINIVKKLEKLINEKSNR